MADKNLALGAAGGMALLAILLKRFAMKRKKRPAILNMPTSTMVDVMANRDWGQAFSAPKAPLIQPKSKPVAPVAKASKPEASP